MAMKKILVCGDNSRAIAAMLVEAMKETGVHIADKPILFARHETYDYEMPKLEIEHRPQTKRGKRKVKRW